MHKKKIAVMTMAIIISNFSATTLEVLADEISNNTSILEINDKKYLLVHAGLMILPNFTLEELLNMQGDKLLWIRERFVSSKIETDYTVIFGHTPVITLDDYVETDDMIKNNLIWKRNNKIGIDCGCGYDKKLACLRLDDMKEYYIDISKQMIEDDVIEYKIKDKEIV